MRLLLVLALAACSGRKSAASAAPSGTRVAVAFSDSLRVVDLTTGTQNSVALANPPATIAAVQDSMGADRFVVMAQKPVQLTAWSNIALGAQPDTTFSLEGFVPSGFAGRQENVLVFSKNAANGSVVLWAPTARMLQRLNVFSSPDLVPSCASAAGDAFIVVGTAPVRNANAPPDEFVRLDAAGTVTGRMTLTEEHEVGLWAPQACVFGPTYAALYTRPATVVLRTDTTYKPIALPSDFALAADARLVWTDDGAHLVIPSRTNGELAVVTGGEVAHFHTAFAGNAMAAQPLAGSPGILLGLGGGQANLVLHFFDGSDDTSLLDFGSTQDLVDLAVVASSETSDVR